MKEGHPNWENIIHHTQQVTMGENVAKYFFFPFSINKTHPIGIGSHTSNNVN